MFYSETNSDYYDLSHTKVYLMHYTVNTTFKSLLYGKNLNIQFFLDYLMFLRRLEVCIIF